MKANSAKKNYNELLQLLNQIENSDFFNDEYCFYIAVTLNQEIDFENEFFKLGITEYNLSHFRKNDRFGYSFYCIKNNDANLCKLASRLPNFYTCKEIIKIKNNLLESLN